MVSRQRQATAHHRADAPPGCGCRRAHADHRGQRLDYQCPEHPRLARPAPRFPAQTFPDQTFPAQAFPDQAMQDWLDLRWLDLRWLALRWLARQHEDQLAQESEDPVPRGAPSEV